MSPTILEIQQGELVILGNEESMFPDSYWSADSVERAPINRAPLEAEPNLYPRMDESRQRRSIAVGRAAVGQETRRETDQPRGEMTDDGAPVDRFADRRNCVEREQFFLRRRKRAVWLIGMFLFAATLGAVVTSPLFRLSNVEVVGNQALSDNTLLDAIGLQSQPSMLSIKAIEIEQRVQAVPLVSAVTVWKKWPRTVVVEVVERFGVAAIRTSTGWSILDQQGSFIETRAQRPMLPELSVSTLPDSAANQPANPAILPPDPSDKRLEPAITLSRLSNAVLRQRIDTVSIQPTGLILGMRPFAASPGIEEVLVKLGRSNDGEAKLRALSTMIDPETGINWEDYSVLDLSVADQPVLVKRLIRPSVDATKVVAP